MSDACPQCGSPGRIVTAVTVRTLGTDPRTVLVTRLCTGPGCHEKYLVFKRESNLEPAEREAWSSP